MRTVIVTGAGGFLGHYVVEELVRRGWNTIALARREPRIAVPGARHVTLTLPAREWESILKEERPHALLHLAGPTSVQASLERPYEDFHESVSLLYECIDGVRRISPETRVLYFSSGAVYGNPASLPVREDATIHPVSPYGLHRVLCENILSAFHLTYGLRSASMRIFSAYGPGLPRQVVWDVCRKALQDETVALFGTGEESRDFIHARDVATAACVILERGRFEREAYNVARGREVTIRTLAEQVLHHLGLDKPVVFSGRARPGDPGRWCADVSLLSSLGFAPQVELDAGLAEVTRWVREQLS